ncbi:hypothetical protein GCM10023107_59690 [Actinoplanes octamycinicus]|nr:hypothetical protein Aoc01nite_71400 [Actinoplanes octamycinicus]
MSCPDPSGRAAPAATVGEALLGDPLPDPAAAGPAGDDGAGELFTGGGGEPPQPAKVTASSPLITTRMRPSNLDSPVPQHHPRVIRGAHPT